MSTFTKENEVLTVVAEKLATVGFVEKVKPPFQIVDGRLYLEVTTGLGGYIMVDPSTKRVKLVYNLSGELDRNFGCTDEQLDTFLRVLATL